MTGSPTAFPLTHDRPAAARTRRTAERVVWSLTAAVAILLLGLVLALTIYGVSHRHTIYGGVSVAGVDLSGLTRAEAAERLEALGAVYGQTPLTVAADDETYTVAPDQIGFDLDSAGSAAQAYGFGRDGSLWRRTQVWVVGLLDGSDRPAIVQIDQGALGSWVGARATDLAVAPVDAAVDLSGGTPVIQPDQAGRDLDQGGQRQPSRLSHAGALDPDRPADHHGQSAGGDGRVPRRRAAPGRRRDGCAVRPLRHRRELGGSTRRGSARSSRSIRGGRRWRWTGRPSSRS